MGHLFEQTAVQLKLAARELMTTEEVHNFPQTTVGIPQFCLSGS